MCSALGLVAEPTAGLCGGMCAPWAGLSPRLMAGQAERRGLGKMARMVGGGWCRLLEALGCERLGKAPSPTAPRHRKLSLRPWRCEALGCVLGNLLPCPGRGHSPAPEADLGMLSGGSFCTTPHWIGPPRHFSLFPIWPS